MSFQAGCAQFAIPDSQTTDSIPVVVMYPAAATERLETLGSYSMQLAREGPIMPGDFPLVVISHGTGGSNLVYRTLARHLARSGFVVAMPEHPRNNRNNNELGGTSAILVNRPRHIRLVMDHMFTHDTFRPVLKADTAAIIGHSLGGYTALAVAGGRATAFPFETPDQQALQIAPQRDPRVKAIVLLAPATAWFQSPDALRDVRVPILMMTAEKDPHTPAWQSHRVLHGVPDPSRVEHKRIANAGHFSFLTPFPPELTRAEFPPSQDPPGFDREAFHQVMNADIEAFLRRVL